MKYTRWLYVVFFFKKNFFILLCVQTIWVSELCIAYVFSILYTEYIVSLIYKKNKIHVFLELYKSRVEYEPRILLPKIVQFFILFSNRWLNPRYVLVLHMQVKMYPEFRHFFFFFWVLWWCSTRKQNLIEAPQIIFSFAPPENYAQNSTVDTSIIERIKI